MRTAHIAEIKTPKGYLLNGLWFGSEKPKTVYIWIHGLGSSVFSKHGIMELLAVKGAAVLAFNNRGHDKLSAVYYERGKKSGRILAGGGAEIFEECVDDIDGALAFARASGAKHIFLIGHSTGCQKSVYWASKRKSGVDGIVLLAPVSDYAGAAHKHGEKRIAAIASQARAMIKKGQGREIIPFSTWSEEPDTWERFVSLYTKDSAEEIFSYAHDRVPKILRSVRIPLLALLAEDDEFADRPASELEQWFLEHIYEGETAVIPGVKHSFKGAEKNIAHTIQNWIS